MQLVWALLLKEFTQGQDFMHSFDYFCLGTRPIK